MRKVIILFAIAVLILGFTACGGGGGSSSSTTTTTSTTGSTSQNSSGNNTVLSKSSSWSAIYGDKGAENMEGVLNTSDGGYIIVGGSTSYTGTDTGDALIVKIDKDGAIEWAKTYGGTDDDTALDIKETSDGGYIVAGWTKSSRAGSFDAWFFKIDAKGNLQWERTFGGQGEEQASSVDTTKDGGYVLTGGTTSFGVGKTDLWVIRLDSKGDMVWGKTYGGTGDDPLPSDYGEYAARVFEDRDGNYVVGTNTTSFGQGSSDIWVIKLRPGDGSIIWEYAYGDIDEDALWDFKEASDGEYIASGLITSPVEGDVDSWVLRIKTDGTLRWQKTFTIKGKSDEALSLGATSDGGALIGSYYETSDTDWTSFLVRIDSDGKLLWSRQYKNDELDWPNALQELSDGSFIVVGVTMPANGTEDIIFSKIADDGSIGTSCSIVSDISPSSGSTSISPVATKAIVKDINTPLQTPSPSFQVKDVTVPSRSICGG